MPGTSPHFPTHREASCHWQDVLVLRSHFTRVVFSV
jgi:hypothetical protein